jgi:proteic killer suppression protein
MILRIRHKGLGRLYTSGDAKGINAQYVKRLRTILAALATSAGPTDMNLPGLRLHPLTGNRKGQWAVSVSGNWRVVFEFEGENVTNVDLIDYH